MSLPVPPNTCANHPEREARWYGENTFLCAECHAKTMIVESVQRAHDPFAPMRRVVGQLVHFALDQLWYQSPDSLPDEPAEGQREDHLGCCPECCAPCEALRTAAQEGYLDEMVLWWPDTLPGTSWWDQERLRVDRHWLWRAWDQTDKLGCSHG